MTKREVLVAICENPGWQPPTDPPSSTERALDELLREGWIMSRLDGWEASPKALEQFPHFLEQEDIADPLGAGAKAEVLEEPSVIREHSPPTTMSYTARIGPRQQVSQEVQAASVKGSVTLANAAQAAETYEAEVTIKLRRV